MFRTRPRTGARHNWPRRNEEARLYCIGVRLVDCTNLPETTIQQWIEEGHKRQWHEYVYVWPDPQWNPATGSYDHRESFNGVVNALSNTLFDERPSISAGQYDLNRALTKQYNKRVDWRELPDVWKRAFLFHAVVPNSRGLYLKPDCDTLPGRVNEFLQSVIDTGDCNVPLDLESVFPSPQTVLYAAENWMQETGYQRKLEGPAEPPDDYVEPLDTALHDIETST
jgi:hypothetical protein